MDRMTDQSPMLIVVGGYPGSGKTAVARQLAVDLHFPRLNSDAIGDTIHTSQAIAGTSVNAMWLAYDIVFGLCSAFIQSGVSTILDLNMGWAFQWQRLNELRTHHPTLRCAIIILRCPREMCHARIRERHRGLPSADPAEQFETEPRFFELWQFIERLDRPDIASVDAARAFEAVYHDVRQRIMPIVSV
jgi:predicted kinase